MIIKHLINLKKICKYKVCTSINLYGKATWYSKTVSCLVKGTIDSVSPDCKKVKLLISYVEEPERIIGNTGFNGCKSEWGNIKSSGQSIWIDIKYLK